jgi:hypothetical protein
MAEKDQTPKALLTARDLLEMGEAGEFCELVDGELVQMSPSFLPEAYGSSIQRCRPSPSTALPLTSAS